MSKKKIVRRAVVAPERSTGGAEPVVEDDDDELQPDDDATADVTDDETDDELQPDAADQPLDADVMDDVTDDATEDAETAPESVPVSVETPVEPPAEPPIRRTVVASGVPAAMYADADYVQNNSPFYPIAAESVAAASGKVVGFVDILVLVQIAIALANLFNGCVANSRLQRMVKSSRSTEHDQVKQRLKRQLAAKFPDHLAEDYRLRIAGEVLNRAAALEQPQWVACTTYAKGMPT